MQYSTTHYFILLIVLALCNLQHSLGSNSSDVSLVALYRYFNAASINHITQASGTWRSSGFDYPGTLLGYGFDTNIEGTRAIYRYYHTNNDHITSSTYPGSGWSGEAFLAYIATDEDSVSNDILRQLGCDLTLLPLNRYYSSSDVNHLDTIGSYSGSGYGYQGTLGYVCQAVSDPAVYPTLEPTQAPTLSSVVFTETCSDGSEASMSFVELYGNWKNGDEICSDLYLSLSGTNEYIGDACFTVLSNTYLVIRFYVSNSNYQLSKIDFEVNDRYGTFPTSYDQYSYVYDNINYFDFYDSNILLSSLSGDIFDNLCNYCNSNGISFNALYVSSRITLNDVSANIQDSDEIYLETALPAKVECN